MRRRVLAQLAAAAEDQPLPPTASLFDRRTRQIALAVLDRDRALGWRLLEAPQTLNIRTIDSLCAELAGSAPLLAGTGGRYTPTTDPDPLYAEAAQRTLLLMGGADSDLTADLESLLLHRDASSSDFCRLLADMLKQREQWGELIPLDPNLLTEEALDEQVRPRLTRTLERLIACGAPGSRGPRRRRSPAPPRHTRPHPQCLPALQRKALTHSALRQLACSSHRSGTEPRTLGLSHAAAAQGGWRLARQPEQLLPKHPCVRGNSLRAPTAAEPCGRVPAPF